MKIQVTDAVRDEADERMCPPNPPIEPGTAKAIATAVVDLLDAGTVVGLPHLREFAASGAIVARRLRHEVGAAFNLLEMDPDDLYLINALIWHVEWHGDREGGPAWRNV